MPRKTKEERDAEFKAELAIYVEREVARAPKLTHEQICIISRAFNGERVPDYTPRPPSAYELEQQRIAKERADALSKAEAIAASMVACDVCDLPPVAHVMQRQHSGGVGFHEWVPGRAQKILEGGSSLLVQDWDNAEDSVYDEW